MLGDIAGDGDANGNGNLDVTDLTIILSYILMFENIELELCEADINADTNIDLLDIILIVNLILD